MGYRSTFVLGIDKRILTASRLIFENLPSLLLINCGTPFEIISGTNTFVYFKTINKIKMYESMTDVNEFYNWLTWMDNTHHSVTLVEIPYGYIELSEDGVSSDRGDAYHFYIYTECSISSPSD